MSMLIPCHRKLQQCVITSWKPCLQVPKTWVVPSENSHLTCPRIWFCLWHTGFIWDMQKLERIQRRWTKRVKGLRNLNYSERLSELGLFSIQGRFTRADLIFYWKIFHGKSYITPQPTFTHPQTDTRGYPLKIMVRHVNTNIRQWFFSQRCINLWNSLPVEVVTATDLQSFKRGLTNAIPDKLVDYV